MKIIFCILFIIVFSRTLGQDLSEKVETIWSPDQILPSSHKIPEIIGHDETGYYVLSKYHRYAIEHYDTTFQHTGKEYIKLNVGIRTRELVAVVHFHDVLYLFTSEMHFRSMLLFVQTIDKKTLKQNNDERLLLEMFNLAGWRAEFGVVLSRKHQKLLVYGRIIAYWQKMQEVQFMVFNDGLTKEWERKERITYDKKPYHEAIFVADDSGNAYMLGLYYDPTIFNIHSPRKNSYIILAFTENGAITKQYFVDFADKYIHGINIEPGKNDDLACVGFYSPRYNKKIITGIFFFTIDARFKNIKYRKFHEFDPFFLAESMELKPKSNIDYLLSFRLDHLAVRKNGNFILTTEQEYDQNYDNYRNIVVICLDPTGEIEWYRTIRKRQSQNREDYPNYCSYNLHAPTDRNRIEIVFNDNLKNLIKSNKHKQFGFYQNGKAYLVSVEIGEIGEMTTKIIYLKSKRKMLTPVPVHYYDMLNNEMVIPSLRSRKFRFCKVTFN